MLDKARERVVQLGWDGIALQCCPAERARIPLQADAALFHFTHDVLRRPDAVANVMRHLKPGARVVASGLKWSDVWACLLYTSDAADERSSVDLGGRRIIKKKTRKEYDAAAINTSKHTIKDYIIPHQLQTTPQQNAI